VSSCWLQRQGRCDCMSCVGTLRPHGSTEVARRDDWNWVSHCQDPPRRHSAPLRRYQRSPGHGLLLDRMSSYLFMISYIQWTCYLCTVNCTSGLWCGFLPPEPSHRHLDTVKLIVQYLYVTPCFNNLLASITVCCASKSSYLYWRLRLRAGKT